MTPKLPGDITDLVNNQPYTLDNTLIGTTVYTHDQYGNQTAAYTLNGWVDPNNGIMGTADVEVAGTWTKEEIPVQTHTITYSWSGLPEEPILDADGNDATPKKPEDNRIYTHNAPYSVDTTFPAGYTVTTYDQYGNPNGAYIFSGWDAVETKGYITADLTFKGEWRYEAAEVAKTQCGIQLERPAGGAAVRCRRQSDRTGSTGKHHRPGKQPALRCGYHIPEHDRIHPRRLWKCQCKLHFWQLE